MTSPYQPTDLRAPTQIPPAPAEPEPRPRPAYQHHTGPAPEQPIQVSAAEARPTMTDTLAEDARAAMTQQAARIPDWPAGAPELRPLMRLPFRERAEAIRRFESLRKVAEKLPEKGEEVTFDRAAEMYDGLAEMDDFLAMVAVDPAAYRAWVADADDAQFGQLFNAYQARMQPGEASSSSS